MNRRRHVLNQKFTIVVILAVVAAVLLSGTDDIRAADQENCMLCHRYSGLSLFQKDGAERIFYVNEDVYRQSVHGRLLCSSCHPDVKEIPHKEAKKVDCSLECHVKDPSSEKVFTHKKVVDAYAESVHGKMKEGLEKDYPTCKYCHPNPMYISSEEDTDSTQSTDFQILKRCLACHENEKWTERFFNHYTYRTRQRQSSKDIVMLCSSCHEDSKKMARHGLEPTWTLKDTFHWEAIKYDSPSAPNCITCHAPPLEEYSVHTIKPLKETASPLSDKEKRLQVCALPNCHPAATENFVSGKIHSAGLKVKLIEDQRGGHLTPLMSEEEKAILLQKEEIEQLKSQVIYFIRLVYKILIGCVVGFMFIHQVLDYLTIRRERKQGGHHA